MTAEAHDLPAAPSSSRAPRPSYTALPDQPQPYPTILDYLAGRFPRVGRAVWEDRMARGMVSDADGVPLTLATPYRVNLRLRYFREVAAEPAVAEREEVLFQSDAFLVACKPHGLPVTPAGPYVNECLLYRLQRRTGIATLVPVHRLDRETAGLVLFSVNPATRGLYGDLFKIGAVRKAYEAVARAPAEDFSDGDRMVESRIAMGTPWFRSAEVPGRPNAQTRLRVLERRGALALFRAEPLTGKQHQIRVHLCAMGCPILNDRLYPALLPAVPPGSEPPLQLLARTLEFTDPVSGQRMAFRSERTLEAWPASGR